MDENQTPIDIVEREETEEEKELRRKTIEENRYMPTDDAAVAEGTEEAQADSPTLDIHDSEHSTETDLGPQVEVDFQTSVTDASGNVLPIHPLDVRPYPDAFKAEALQQAVKLHAAGTAGHRVAPEPTIASAKMFEAYLRGDE